MNTASTSLIEHTHTQGVSILVTSYGEPSPSPSERQMLASTRFRQTHYSECFSYFTSAALVPKGLGSDRQASTRIHLGLFSFIFSFSHISPKLHGLSSNL